MTEQKQVHQEKTMNGQLESKSAQDALVPTCNCWRSAEGHAHGCPFYVPTLDDRLRWFQYATNEYEAAKRGSEREAHYAERIESERRAIHALFAAARSEPCVPDALPAAPAPMVCDRCDGCGWYEGGKALQTACTECGGTGVVTA